MSDTIPVAGYDTYSQLQEINKIKHAGPSVKVSKRTSPDHKLTRLSLRWWNSKRRTLKSTFFLTVVLLPAAALWHVTVSPHPPRPVLYVAAAYFVLSALAITAGYHRLCAHRAWRTNHTVGRVLALAGASAGIGSIRWWVAMHRAHHRFTDDPMRDPCCSKRGYVWAHTGWVLHNPHLKLQAAVAAEDDEGTDIVTAELIAWQDRHYWSMFVFSGIFVPAFLGWLVGDWIAGVVYIGMVRMFLVQQVSFLQNSLCHCPLGYQTFGDTTTSRDLALWNVLTFGEGMHNFHHAFPRDYRCGNVNWYDFDPAKWFILALYQFNLAWDLHVSPHAIVEQLKIQQMQKQLDSTRARLNWGIPLDKLPVISPATFRSLAEQTKDERVLVVISGIVHDVTPFVEDHPGGVALVKTSNGKDATLAFNGAVYSHSNAAKNLLATMRVAVLGSHQQEVWKQHALENKDVPVKNDADGRRIVRSGEQATMVGVIHKSADAA